MQSMENSTGTLASSYATYMDSITAHTDIFKAAWNELANSAINSDLFIGIVDVGTSIVTVITNIVDAIGLLPPVLAGVGIYEFVQNLD